MDEIQKSKGFEEKMRDRIRESIGDLITDEELGKVVARGIEEAFFKERPVINNWGNHVNTKEPLMHEVVRDLLRDEVKTAVQDWFKNNPDAAGEVLDKTIRDGITKVMMQTLDSMFYGAMTTMRENIRDSIQKGML